jgi:hypothetical protein
MVAAGNLDIEKIAIADPKLSVVLDPIKSSGFTNKYGEVNIVTKFLKGVNGSTVRLFC